MPQPRRPSLYLPFPGRRAVVVGAGSFGTAIAVLLARGGLRTTLQARTPEQARRLQEDRENVEYLSGVELPRELRIEDIGALRLEQQRQLPAGVAARRVLPDLPKPGIAAIGRVEEDAAVGVPGPFEPREPRVPALSR